MGHAMPYLPMEGATGKLIVIEGTDGCGRSTQAIMLKEWLEVQGYAVIDTGWTRSKLVGKAITDAKEGHSLHRLTYCLMYATDLADRMEYQIIPALKSGFIVLADRYIYTLLARRGAGCRQKLAAGPLFIRGAAGSGILFAAWHRRPCAPRPGSGKDELLGERAGYELGGRSVRQLRGLSGGADRPVRCHG